MSAPISDPLLANLRAAALRGPQAASDALGQLLLGEAAPLLWRTIRSQLAGVPAGDQEEVHSAALLRLTERLQAWIAEDPEVEIDSLRAYVAATGANGCRAWLRARHPDRTRPQNQLRYLLRHDPELALWEGPGGGLLCGLATWRQATNAPAGPGATSRRPAMRRWLGFAAAAVLLVALGVEVRHDLRQPESTAASLAQRPEPAQRSAKVVFTDSFEDASTEHWSN